MIVEEICLYVQELSADIKSSVTDNSSLLLDDADTNLSLLGSVVWDVYQEREQLEALSQACQSSSELGFEKVFSCSNTSYNLF